MISIVNKEKSLARAAGYAPGNVVTTKITSNKGEQRFSPDLFHAGGFIPSFNVEGQGQIAAGTTNIQVSLPDIANFEITVQSMNTAVGSMTLAVDNLRAGLQQLGDQINELATTGLPLQDGSVSVQHSDVNVTGGLRVEGGVTVSDTDLEQKLMSEISDKVSNLQTAVGLDVNQRADQALL